MLAAVVALTVLAAGTRIDSHRTAQPVSAESRSLAVRLVRRCPEPEQCVPLDVVQSMRDEAERIWARLGVRINWFDVDRESLRSLDHGALMVFLESTDAPPFAGRGPLLGATHHPAAACGLGVAWIWVSEARRHAAAVRLNGIRLWKLPERFGHSVLARALGRVIAHEIGHYLLESTSHSAKGLMRAELTIGELLEPATEAMYGLDGSQRQRLLACAVGP